MKWQDVFVYDTSSPSHIRWKNDVLWGRCLNVVKYRAKDVAGCQNTKGYFVVRHNRKLYYVHRIVYELHYGYLPESMEVDHVDGVKSNNSISNLTLKTHTKNMRNMSKTSANTSGVTGVSFCSNTNRWRCCWTDIYGKRHSKYFSVSKYGNDVAFNLACQWREDAISTENKLGAGYTERHGT